MAAGADIGQELDGRARGSAGAAADALPISVPASTAPITTAPAVGTAHRHRGDVNWIMASSFTYQHLCTMCLLRRDGCGRRGERDAFVDERFHVCRQVGDVLCSSLTTELAEREDNRHPPPDALGAVALTGQPRDIGFDLRRDLRAAQPTDGRRLDEVLLQHGQPPFCR
jgi:hypothetical protein